MNPKGNRSIYRRRRLIVLAIGLLFVTFIFWLISTGVNLITTQMNAANDTVKADTGSTEQIGDKNCVASDISLALSLHQQDFPSAGGAHFFLQTTYLGNTSCKMATNNTERVLTITSGADAIYNSGGCQASADTGLLLTKGDSVEQEIVWNARRGGENGCATGDTVKPGTYVARISFPTLTNVQSNEVVFSIQ